MCRIITRNEISLTAFLHRSSEEGGSASSITGSVFWFSVPVILPANADKVLSDSLGALKVKEGEVKIAAPAVTDSDKSDETATVRSSTASANKVGSVNKDEEIERDVFTEMPSTRRNPSLKRKVVCAGMDLVPQSIPQRRKKCALIIEDSKVIRKVLHRALTNFGFEVKQAENGMQGLEEMKSNVFDVVLCDFLMPVMDG